MGLTKAQKHNRMMDKIFQEAREIPSSLNKFYWRNGKVVKRRKTSINSAAGSWTDIYG